MFFSLLVIAVAFMPVFTLVDQEGRLFRPLAYSKNLAMAIAALLAVTLDPGHAHAVRAHRAVPVPAAPAGLDRHPAVRRQVLLRGAASDQPAAPPALRGAVPLRAAPRQGDDRRERCSSWRATVPVYLAARLRVHAAAARGHDPLHAVGGAAGHVGGRGAEGAAGPGQAAHDLPRGRARLRQGRPRRHFDRSGAVLDDGDHDSPQARGRVAGEAALVLALGARVAQGHPAPVLARPDHRGRADHEMDATLQLPGITNAWTMPIKGRLDMLSTGIRTPVGIKIIGADLAVIEQIALEIEAAVQQVPGTRQRLRRARRRRLLPRLRAQARSARPLRPVRRRRQHDGDDRGRRRQPDHDGRGARALRHQRPLRPRLPRRPRGAQARAAAAARTGRGRSRWRRSPTCDWSRARR